jgi:FlaA1/EpsC-like NDP-sugar epimerase
MHWTLKCRRVAVIVIQAALVALSNYAAFWLRFDGNLPEAEEIVFYRTLLWVVAIRTAMFVPFRLYEGLWRYTGMWDLVNIIKSVALGTLALFLLVHGFYGQWAYPRSVYIIDSVVLICLLGGIRLVRRFYRELMNSSNGKRLLIYGAGDAGEMIIRDMKRYAEYAPIGFVDDDPRKVGQRIHGVPVLGTRHDLPRIMEREKPHEVLVALPDDDVSVIRRVVEALQPYKVPITTLPALRDILNGRFVVDQIRSLSIDDLLPRAPVGLESATIQRLIAGKRVLVTGAGGSIGSELSRQIAAFEPEKLILFERYENGLYDITNDLLDRAVPVLLAPVIGDVTDRARLNAVMAEYRPHLVFHAAAHKHVPLMEQNPCEAVKNNVMGTRLVAEAADRNGVELFVLISTDKAVNPSSVMGATKRVAELILQSMTGRARTSFVTVRFGNVLGSNGSLVPRFLGQIKAGGPVTVTHPEIRRYFMLIPEAVQLVLHAAATGQNGGVYTLEMGDQIKVLDMARNLIRLSGFVPDEDIPIVFIGLRPGEKLSEELVGADETIEESGVSKIFRVRSAWNVRPELVQQDVVELERLAAANQQVQLVRQLCRLLPSFTPEAATAVSKDSGAEEPRPILPLWADTDRWSHGRPPRSAAVFVDRRDPNRQQRWSTLVGGRRLTDIIAVPERQGEQPVGSSAKP